MRTIIVCAVSVVGLIVNGMCTGACLAYGGPMIGWGLMFLLLAGVNGYVLFTKVAR